MNETYNVAAHARNFRNFQKLTDWAKIWYVAYFKAKTACKKISASYDQFLLRNRAKRFEKVHFLTKLCNFKKTTL